MTQHADLIGVEGHGVVSHMDGALAFTEAKTFAERQLPILKSLQIA